tara:strand:- start:251 stop:595 length:345 start_codon:yes stop_codon:yes gene_type:complete
MLINQPTPDIAVSSSGVTEAPLVRGDVTGSVTIGVQGLANQVIYTVPDGFYFTGYIYMNNSSSNVYTFINGNEMRLYNNTTYGNRAYPFNLYAGDILSVGTSSTFNLLGLLRKA